MEFLKCDAQGCDHEEEVELIAADMIGKPCPKCGASLLTESDYRVYAAFCQPVMRAMHELGLTEPATPETPEAERVRVHYHDGELRISTKPEITP